MLRQSDEDIMTAALNTTTLWEQEVCSAKIADLWLQIHKDQVVVSSSRDQLITSSREWLYTPNKP